MGCLQKWNHNDYLELRSSTLQQFKLSRTRSPNSCKFQSPPRNILPALSYQPNRKKHHYQAALLSTQKFDDKLIKHLSTFSTNIMKTPPQNNSSNPPEITKMRHNKVYGKTYSKDRQHRPTEGGLGRGSGTKINRNLGGPYGRGIGQGGGGGGSGLVSEDHTLSADKTYEGRSDKIDGVSTTGDVSNDHTMDIDIESSLQHAVGSSSAAIMSFMAWVVAAEQNMA
jgi:hypothetical protein